MTAAPPEPTFQSPEIAEFWRFIASSLDRLVTIVETESLEVLNYRPSAPAANSIVALAEHTLGNAEENLLGVLGGMSIARDHSREFGTLATPDRPCVPDWPARRSRLERQLAAMPASRLETDIVHPRRGVLRGRAVLIVVARHVAEHLGQAELTRDLAHAATNGR